MTEVEGWQEGGLGRMLEGEVGWKKEETKPRRVELCPYTKNKITATISGKGVASGRSTANLGL
jgi:hypothetical protein